MPGLWYTSTVRGHSHGIGQSSRRILSTHYAHNKVTLTLRHSAFSSVLLFLPSKAALRTQRVQASSCLQVPLFGKLRIIHEPGEKDGACGDSAGWMARGMMDGSQTSALRMNTVPRCVRAGCRSRLPVLWWGEWWDGQVLGSSPHVTRSPYK